MGNIPKIKMIIFLTLISSYWSGVSSLVPWVSSTSEVYANERFTETTPPVEPVRPVAEFEPASHVMIRWPLGIPLSLVAQLSNTAEVICLVSNTANQNSATTAFSNAGVNMARVSFMVASTDSYWTRDFGPWFVFNGDGELGVVDFQYNRDRPNDNLIPQRYAQQFGLPYYGMNVVQTGGNYMTDGIHTAAQTMIAYTENNNNQDFVNNQMSSYLGIESYHVLEDPNNTYIDHIDCWGKFLAPDKVLIRSVPTTHAQYSAIEATAAYFATRSCAWGYPYKVYRVYTPGNQPYTNSLILNKRVFVPIMNNVNDAAALQVYRNAMPGYEVLGFTGSWESTDALHCRTHEIPDKDMLHISHQPYFGIKALSETTVFDTYITAHSNASLYADSLYIGYKINNGEWQQAWLTPVTGNRFSGFIDGYSYGDTIRYYLHAADQSGRSADHPMFAKLDPHLFVIERDMLPPTLVHVPMSSIGNQSTPVSFYAQVSDQSAISNVVLRYHIDYSAIQESQMFEELNGLYRFDFNTSFSNTQDYFYYSIIAEDVFQNSHQIPDNADWYAVPITGSSANEEMVAQAVGIERLYPNPMRKNDSVTIEFGVSKSEAASMSIYNIKGQLVFNTNKYNETVNQTSFLWDGRDNSGKLATNGVYFCIVSIGGTSHKRKLIIAQ